MTSLRLILSKYNFFGIINFKCFVFFNLLDLFSWVVVCILGFKTGQSFSFLNKSWICLVFFFFFFLFIFFFTSLIEFHHEYLRMLNSSAWLLLFFFLNSNLRSLNLVFKQAESMQYKIVRLSFVLIRHQFLEAVYKLWSLRKG